MHRGARQAPKKITAILEKGEAAKQRGKQTEENDEISAVAPRVNGSATAR